MSVNIQELLDEREKTHGDFTAHSEISQSLKSCLWHREGWLRLNMMQREALEMVCHKVARILAGDPNHIDHWRDGAGYFTLVADRLQRDLERPF